MRRVFKLPTTGRATYCGFWDAWATNKDRAVTLMGSQVTIKTTFQHIPNVTKATINTFSISEIGATNNGAVDLSENGAAKFSFKLIGPNGQALNGGSAQAILEFYGPNAIQLSATFSSSRRSLLLGTWRISGGLLANRCG
jgi:hypothetical protein